MILRIMVQRKIGNCGLSVISMRVNKDKYKILLENIFLNRIFKKGKSLSNSVIQKHGESGFFLTSMKMRRKMSKLWLILIFQDQLVPHSSYRRSRFHNSLETQKHGEIGSFHISMRMKRKTSKLSSMLTYQDKLQHLNFSKKMKMKSHSSSGTLRLGNNGSVVISTTKKHRMLRKQQQTTWMVGHSVMVQWISMTIKFTYTMVLNATMNDLQESSASMNTTTVIISYKTGKSHNSLETQKHGESGFFHISMKMRRKTFKLLSMLISQDKLVLHSSFRRSRFLNSLVTLMHGESGFFLTLKKMNKIAYKSCSMIIFQDKVLATSTYKTGLAMDLKSITMNIFHNSLISMNMSMVTTTYRSLVRCKDRILLLTLVDG